MGRKIPGRKHKGVRDPVKQQAERFNKIKDKINAPPTAADEQYISKSLQRVIDLKNKVKEGKIPVKLKNRKKKSGEKLIKVEQPKYQLELKDRPEKPLPAFKQNPGENDDVFYNRVSRMCNGILKENAFEERYRVDVKRNSETGAVEKLVKRPRDTANDDKSKQPKLTKSQKKTVKLKEKKRLKQENSEYLDWPEKDDIKFGDIVHQPPSLNAPRKATILETPRPGKRNLILQNVLGKKSTGVDKKVIDRTSKRKDLPLGVRRQLEKQRDDVVNAYKLLKANKYNKQNV